MRKTVLALLVGGLALTGCEKANTPEATPETPAETEATPSPATPSPAEPAPEEPPKAAAAATPRPLAPEGVYFLRAAQSIETDAGIVGVKRGQQLTKTSAGTYTTAAGETLTLSPDAVTNDIEEIRQILGGEQQASASLAAWKQQQTQVQTAQQAQVAATPAANPVKRPATTSPNFQPRAAASTPNPATTTAATGAKGGLGTTHSNDRNKKYQDPVSGRWYWKDVRGRRHYE